jgi:hypothetical protein
MEVCSEMGERAEKKGRVHGATSDRIFPLVSLFRARFSVRPRDRMNNLSVFTGFVGPGAEDARAPLDSRGRRPSLLRGSGCLASPPGSSCSSTTAAHPNCAGWLPVL